MYIKFSRKLETQNIVLAALLSSLCIIFHIFTKQFFSFGVMRISLDWLFMFLIVFTIGWSWGIFIVILLDTINLLISGGMGTWRWYFAVQPLLAITLLMIFNNTLHKLKKWISIMIIITLMFSTLLIMNVVHFIHIIEIKEILWMNIIILIGFLFLIGIELYIKNDHGLILSLVFVYFFASMFWGTFSMLNFLGLKITNTTFLKFFTPRLIKMIPEVVISYLFINAFFMIKNKR